MSKKINKDDKARRRKGKPISLEEGIRLLGAEKVPEVAAPKAPGVFDFMALSTRIARRMSSRRGRPTCPEWTVSRKIPMSEQTWEQCKRLAAESKKAGQALAAGQVAAMAIEAALAGKNLAAETARPQRAASFPPSLYQEAEAVSRAARQHSYWDAA